MAKKQIKLSEAQLRDMIAENVNKVLSELDWKTYANARKKAADKGQYDKSMKFGNAANNAFNDKFGYQGDKESEYNAPNVRGDIFLNRVEAQNNDYPSHTIQRLYNYDNDKQEYSNPKNYDSTKAFGLMDKYNKDGRYKRIWNPSLKRFFNNPEQEKAYRTASKEMDDYVMGNYGYDKGKGWQLKEDKIAKIVAESVKKVLKEDENIAPYYVDIDGEEFFDYNEAYKHAYEIAKQLRAEDGRNMEDVLLMDNEEWVTLVKFTYDGIYDIEGGTFMPW